MNSVRLKNSKFEISRSDCKDVGIKIFVFVGSKTVNLLYPALYIF